MGMTTILILTSCPLSPMETRMSGVVAFKLLDDVQRVAFTCPVVFNALEYQRATHLPGTSQDFLMAEPVSGNNVRIQLLCDLLASFGNKTEPVINSGFVRNSEHITA